MWIPKGNLLPSKDGEKDGGDEDEDGDKDNKDTDDDEAPKETKPKEPKPNKAKSKEAKPKDEKPEQAKQEEAKPQEAKEAAHPTENGVTSPKTQVLQCPVLCFEFTLQTIYLRFPRFFCWYYDLHLFTQ